MIARSRPIQSNGSDVINIHCSSGDKKIDLDCDIDINTSLASSVSYLCFGRGWQTRPTVGVARFVAVSVVFLLQL